MYIQRSIYLFCAFVYFGSSSVLGKALDEDLRDSLEKEDTLLESNNLALNEINRKLDSIIDTLKNISTKIEETSRNCSKDDVPKPKSCAELRLGGANFDGIYEIFPRGLGRAVKVVCDMTTEGGGWTVIVRKGNYSGQGQMISFNRSWEDYKNGFGHIEGEYWLGNDVIHLMTTEETNELRVNLNCQFDQGFGLGTFVVGNESSNYALHVDVLAAKQTPYFDPFLWILHNNSSFSTYDRGNRRSNCAKLCNGGWWYKDSGLCYMLSFTGNYFQEEKDCQNINFLRWDLKANNCLNTIGTGLLIRPFNFTAAG